MPQITPPAKPTHPTRRTFTAGLAATLAAPALAQLTQPLLPGNPRPNVLMLVVDDLGYGDLGCYGSTLSTPNLNLLALESVLCTACNAAHSTPVPSTAALLTGRCAARNLHGTTLDPAEQTLAHLFAAAGYRTGSVGEWPLAASPQAHGFASAFIPPSSAASQRSLTPATQAAAHFLTQPSPQPFFLYLRFPSPLSILPEPPSATPTGVPPTPPEHGPYGAGVSAIDQAIGALLLTLEQTKHKSARLAQNTIVWFSSSNGPGAQGSTGGYRGGKGSTLEGGFRVPLLIRWPGHIVAGSRTAGWVTALSALPSFTAWCGLPQPRLPLDGTLLDPVLKGERSRHDYDPQLYFAAPNPGWQLDCIRAGPWKLRLHPTPAAPVQLVKLSDDGSESYDVASSNPRVLARLHAYLRELAPGFPPTIPLT